jgi:hypothetical protein
MSDDADVFGDVPTGRKLPSGPTPGNVGVVNTHGQPATDERVAHVRRFFAQGNVDDVDVAGEHDAVGGLQVWVDRASGRRYKRVSSSPLATGDPRSTGITIFVVDGGVIAFLQPADDDRNETIEVGSVSGRQVKASPRRDDEERWIY